MPDTTTAAILLLHSIILPKVLAAPAAAPSLKALSYHKNMANRVEAIYENGALRPLQPLELAEHERVTLDILPSNPGVDLDHGFVARCRAEVAGVEKMSLEQIQGLLSSMTGTFEEAIDEERGPR